MASTPLRAVGHNGQLELTDSVLRIERKGAVAFLTQGLKGVKEIRISQISSIQFKAATVWTNGYIQFGFLGGQEGKAGVFQAGLDENTVMFRTTQQSEFVALRDELNRHIASSTSAATSAPSAIDEIEKLGKLRDKGLVTEEEFQKKKRQLLGL